MRNAAAGDNPIVLMAVALFLLDMLWAFDIVIILVLVWAVGSFNAIFFLVVVIHVQAALPAW